MYVTRRLIFFKSEKNGYLLFCGNSNSFYQIDEDNAPMIKKMIETGDDSYLSEKIKKEFIKSGVLLPENDEAFYRRMKYYSYNSRFSKDSLSLTIAPTMACNFRCTYCYEQNRATDLDIPNSIMSDDVLFGIIEFIKKSEAKNVNICWYGGEPLCAWKKIIAFNKKMKNAGLNNYTQSIVTNGSLLDEEKIKYFDKKKFTNIQITLDGSENYHNQSRPMKNGENSFKAVIHGLDLIFNYCKKTNHRIPVNIRVNISKDNAAEFCRLYKYLNDRYEKMFRIYSSPVRMSTENDKHASSCMNNLKQIEFILTMAKKYRIEIGKLFPSENKLLCCGAQSISNFVISPNGDLFKCWDDIELKSLSVGNILEGYKDYNNTSCKYILESTAFENSECKECVFLYSCLGGCPRIRFNKENGLKISLCSLIKEAPQEFLETYFELKNI